MEILGRLGTILDRILGIMAFIAGLMLVFIALIVVSDISTRLLFNKPIFWTIEVSEISLLYIAFLGGAWLLARDKHVKMELVVDRVSPKTRRILNIMTAFLGILVFLVLTWYTGKEAWAVLKAGAVAETQLGEPKIVIFAIIPIGSFFLFLQSIRRLYGFLKSRET